MRQQSVLDFTLWGGGPHQDGTITWVPRENEAGKTSQELKLDPSLDRRASWEEGTHQRFHGCLAGS